MNLSKIFIKVRNRFSTFLFKLWGWDAVALAKVVSRSDLKQLGSDYGGWVIPTDLLSSNSICYCVGCGEDISFDLELIKQFNCHIFAFDPTPRSIKFVKENTKQNKKYHFFNIGLWDKQDKLRFYVPQNLEHVSHSFLNLQKTDDYIEVKVDRLSNLMKENGHERIDLLKLDIEGSEYKVIDSIVDENIYIGILCVEFDEYQLPLDVNSTYRIRTSINKLLAANYSLVCSQGKGNYTFVRKD